MRTILILSLLFPLYRYSPERAHYFPKLARQEVVDLKFDALSDVGFVLFRFRLRKRRTVSETRIKEKISILP